MPPETTTKEQVQRAIAVICDTCADIRSLYGALALRKKKGKLGEVEELAQEQDTTALLQLEEDLDDYWDTALAMGIGFEQLVEIVRAILPQERREQLLKKKNPDNVVIGQE